MSGDKASPGFAHNAADNTAENIANTAAHTATGPTCVATALAEARAGLAEGERPNLGLGDDVARTASSRPVDDATLRCWWS